jgi:tetratricopeptide (TPR) repeat protein
MTIHPSTLLVSCFLLTGASAGFAAGSAPMTAPTQPNIAEKAREVQKKAAPDARTSYNEGYALMKARRYGEAQAKFEAALKANPRLAGPELAKVHNNLAFCLRKQSPANFSRALEHYNEALKLNPKLAEAYEYRGVLYAEMNRKADAEKDLATLKRLNPKLAADLEEAIKTGKEKEY